MSKQSPKDPKFRCNICKEYYYAPEYLVHYQCPKHGYLCEKHVGQKDMLVFGHDDKNNPNKIKKKNVNPKDDPYFDIIINLPALLINNCLCDVDDNFMDQIDIFTYVGPDNFDKTLINELKEYDLDQFKDEIGENIVDEFVSVGLDTWGALLESDFDQLKRKTNLNDQTITSALNKLKELAIEKFNLVTDSSLVLFERQFSQRKCGKNPSKYLWNNNIQRWLEFGEEKVDDYLNKEGAKVISKNNNIEIKLLLDLFENDILSKEQFLKQIKEKI